MREILFRAKRKDNGEWVEGFLFKTQEHTYIAYAEQFDDDLFLSPKNIFIEVIPETVGQYTGLTDKNGKKIFEGDICQIKGISYIDETPFVIEWNNEYCGWFWKDLNFASATDGITQDITKTAKIIGNIHDNHELLKGE